jgi:hypothetical protein
MEPAVSDIVMWVDDVTMSSAQLQKAYDWRIAQWATLSNTILTAVFFLLATALVETYKETFKRPHLWWWVVGISLTYLCSYLFCRWKIRQLGREFLGLYTLLLELA